MIIRIANRIIIKDPSAAVKEYCRKNLVLDNPDYYKLERMGKYTGNTPSKLYLYEEMGTDWWLPFGCLQDIWRIYPHKSAYINEISPIEPRKYESHINLYPYQREAVNKALYAKNGVLVMPCGSGKGLPIDAKICTPIGWKRNGDLQVGDAVVGSDGKATRVTGIFDRGKVDAYKITFSDGVETVCDKDHLWTVQKQSQRAESGNWFVENTENIYKHYQNMKCRSQLLYIPIVEPVEFYGYGNYRNMNPWLLGFLLGDGCFQKSMITMSTSEDDIRGKVVDIIGNDYGACEWIVHKKNYDWRFCGGYTLHDIRSLGLECKHSYEKFIPKEYLFAPIEVRLAVLQGLFDADGHISNGMTYEYSTTSKQLADDVVFIVESLGGTAKVKEKIPTYTYNGEKRTGRKAYRIFFKLYNFKPFTSKKHSAAYRERTHYNKAYRIIKKIEPCEPITSRCITVDAKDQLYVTEHFVVTHNTQCGLEIIARIGGRALWLTHTQDLLNQSKSRAESVLGQGGYGTITAGKVNVGTHITFALVQTLAKRIDILDFKDQFDVIIVDECMPGETLIDTPAGKKELKNLRKDDIITSFNRNTGQLENKPITHIFKNKAHNIVLVNLENGEKIICTDNHPIFTNTEQWVDAGRLKNDDYVLRLVRQGSQYRCNADYNKKQNKKKGLLLLLQRMFSKRRSQKGCMDGRTQEKSIGNDEKYKQSVSRSVCGENENRQSDEKCRSEESCIKQAERDRTSSQNQMWKWDGINSSTTDVNDCTCKNTEQCVCRISDTNKNAEGERISDLLQSGYCVTGISDSDRDRRRFALCDRTPKSGQEENEIFEWVRVESVTVQKQTSDGTFGGLCADGYVYNIEVEDNNNYFANGILVHNCQHAAGSPTKVTQFYKVISRLSARYKIGLTATPKRADGLQAAMFALLGPKIHEVTREEVAHTTCPVKVQMIETGWMPDYDAVLMGDGTIDYNKVIDAMIHDEGRFQVVWSAIAGLYHAGAVMVLANRVEYLQRLCEAYNKGQAGKAVCLSGQGQSKKAKAERKQALEALNNGEIDCVFATYQLAKEGLDVPNLRYVVFATPEKDPTTVEQSTGRVGRKADGKSYGTVIDFVDEFGMYKGWYKKRMSVYKKIGCDIME